MKRAVIGYIVSGRGLGEDEETFLKLAKKKNVELMIFKTCEGVNEKEIEEKIKKCDLIYNSSAEDFAVELQKTMEVLGKKVIDSSKSYYYSEDKWMFYLKCREHKIPTPETILLLEDMVASKKELKNFGHWPVILKRIQGTIGAFVDKADNLPQAEMIIKKFWKKGDEKLPIIAQEFIKSPSYRVTVIGGKIVQIALKENKGWKATGVYTKRLKKFKVDKKLKEIINKMVKIFKIDVCGIDFLKKDGDWVALEINAEPAFDFFESKREELINHALNFLKKEALKNK